MEILEDELKRQCIAIFVFYNKSYGAQSKLSFSKDMKHCNVITFDGHHWIQFEFERTGFLTRKLHCKSGAKLIEKLPTIKEVSRIIAVIVDDKHEFMWSPWMARSCNEFSRYAAGVNIGFTFNPAHLYKKLLKYTNVRNYKILCAWRRNDGILRRR